MGWLQQAVQLFSYKSVMRVCALARHELSLLRKCVPTCTPSSGGEDRTLEFATQVFGKNAAVQYHLSIHGWEPNACLTSGVGRSVRLFILPVQIYQGRVSWLTILDKYSQELSSSQTKPARTAQCSCLKYCSLFFCQLRDGKKVASASGTLVEAKPITITTIADTDAVNKCLHRHFSCTCKVIQAITAFETIVL